MAATKPSPLLRLPAELRNHIYELVLTQTRPVCSLVALSRRGKGKGLRMNCGRNVVALMQTCSQIRKESAKLFFSCNEFVFKRGNSGTDAHLDTQRSLATLYEFLTAIGPHNAEALRAVVFDYFWVWSDMADPDSFGCRLTSDILRTLSILATKNPHWHLRARINLPLRMLSDEYSKFDCGVEINLANPTRSLQAVASRLRDELQTVGARPWIRIDGEAALGLVYRWQDVLTWKS